jgi:hypothetical protein
MAGAAGAPAAPPAVGFWAGIGVPAVSRGRATMDFWSCTEAAYWGRIFRRVTESRARWHGGTQCFDTSAPWPASTSTDRRGRCSVTGATNCPGCGVAMCCPNKMASSEQSDKVQKGRKKSWWSTLIE